MDDQLLNAVYFADYDLLSAYDVAQLPANFTVNVRKAYRKNNEPFLEVSVTELLKMSYDAWYDIKDKPELKPTRIWHDRTDSPVTESFIINPSEIITSINRCLGLFHIDPLLFDVDYQKYTPLIYSNYDEEWIDDMECKEFLQKGYRQIDLDLINAAQHRNKAKVIELLNSGANPYTDPFDGTEESAILDLLVSNDSLNFIEYVWHWQHRNIDVADSESFFYAFKSLYAAASASEIYRAIAAYKKTA